eukprot:5201040-Prorocentrum_lima.AAC.1
MPVPRRLRPGGGTAGVGGGCRAAGGLWQLMRRCSHGGRRSLARALVFCTALEADEADLEPPPPVICCLQESLEPPRVVALHAQLA